MTTSGRKLGSQFEWRVAKALGGTVYAGQDGDVEARGYRVECKLRTNFKFESYSTLKDWFDQIKRYEDKNPDIPFVLALSGGGSYQRGRIWIATDIEEWKRLTDPSSNRAILDKLEAIREAVEKQGT